MGLLAAPGATWRMLSPDGRVLFITRSLRLFAYGLISLVLVIYLVSLGFSQAKVGVLLTLTLAGDTVISFWLTTTADRFGRKKTLLMGALLMLGAGAVFAVSGNFWVLLIAATIGVISPSGNEVGPFLSVEQAAISQTLSGAERTMVFAWYNVAGSLATALGALSGGWLLGGMRAAGVGELNRYRVVVLAYAGIGGVLMVLFTRLSRDAEAPRALPTSIKRMFGLHRSKKVVLGLSVLFAMDAFGGGFVVQSIMAYWFTKQFGLPEQALGEIFFWANALAGFSGLIAAQVARKIGLIATMVLTHLPSNVLLILVPLMPNAGWAIAMLLARFSISQMDVPTRQSYTMAVVDPDERSAASGVTGVARSTGASVSPMIALILLGTAATAGLPFTLAGGIKIIYDLLLWRAFKAVKPVEERKS